MKILQIFNKYLHPGGEEKSVERIFRHLSERHRMSRCLFDSREWTGKDAPGKWGQVRRLFSNPDAAGRLNQALDEERPDAILAHNIYPVASPAVYEVAMRRRIPVIQYLHNFRPFSVGGTLYSKGRIIEEPLDGSYAREVWHGSWQGSRLKSAIFALMLRRMHRKGFVKGVNTWIAISDFMRDKLLEHSCMPPDSIHALRHSWDAMPTPPDQADDGSYLFLGRLVEEKGIAPLCEAWRLLRDKLGERTPVLHVAGRGPIESLVAGHAAHNPFIKFHGQVEGGEKARLLRHCRAVVVPSTWWEPLGIVVYEAYDCGKPVLAAAAGGLSETVTQGYSGWLHQPGNPGALASDVMRMEHLSDSERAVMGRNARQWLLEQTGVDHWQDRFDAILKARNLTS